MDGLPKNKKPWNKEHERQQIALDDYLFERKLQEVYDKKSASNDLPVLFKKISRTVKKATTSVKMKVGRKSAAVPAANIKKKPAPPLIDAPYIAPKKFVKKTKVSKQRTTRRSFKLPKSKRITAALAVLILVVGVGAFTVVNKKSQTKKDSPKVAGAVSAQKPDFDTLMPSNTSDESKIKFDPTKKVATFQDTIEGGRIVVNQQKLGETELKDAEFLRRTALAFNLKTEVTTKKGQAFIGENRETNTQFAFFVYKDFLFLIQADKTYKYQTIVEYIDGLQ